MKTKRLMTAAISAFAGCALLLTACNKEKPEMTNPAGASAVTPKAGTLTVRMTDSPGDYVSFEAEITRVEAYLENKGWVTLNNQTQIVSVLELTNGTSIELASASNLDAGLYSKLKVTFGEENFIRFNSDFNTAGIALNAQGEATLRWDGPREVEININHEIGAQAGATVLLDFNVAQSIYRQLNEYILDPVITEVEDISTGVQGRVENSTNAAVMLSDGVYTYSTYINSEGQFLLTGVDPGLYDLTIIPSGIGQDGVTEQEMEGVLVTQGEITQIGSVQF